MKSKPEYYIRVRHKYEDMWEILGYNTGYGSVPWAGDNLISAAGLAEAESMGHVVIDITKYPKTVNITPFCTNPGNC